MTEDIYSFVFRGFLTDQALDRTGRLALIASSAALDQEVAKRLSLHLLDEQFIMRARSMATVYTAIAAFENSVRELVSTTLLEEKGETWWDLCVSEKIRVRAESRRDEESKIRWHTPRGDALLNYTEFGDLTAIIQQNWTVFEDLLRSQEWVRDKISTLERSRNVIMHSGELQNEDLERIGGVIRDWVRQVGA
jgi:hypothetical protein